MISLEELKDVAKLKGIRNIGFAEKDYLIDIILLLISKSTKDELVFKGGTCLYKFYKLNRFSEDIDFTARKYVDTDALAKAVISGLAAFGINSNLKQKKKMRNSVIVAIKSQGPLYMNTAQSSCSIRIDINFKSGIEIEPANSEYSPIYKEVPRFPILIMAEKEILAEKVRAIMTRNKARDVYDLWRLLLKGIEADKGLIAKKMEYYNMKFTFAAFERSVNAKKAVWEKELAPLVFGAIPQFSDAKKEIMMAMK